MWQQAKAINGYNSNVWRQDFAGAWIRHDCYGQQSEYGWEIDHKIPQSCGGSDTRANIWPLHWRNNRYKGNMYPEFKTIVSSEGNCNIEKLQLWKW